MIREAALSDIARLVELGRVMHAESPVFSRLSFDADVLADTLAQVVRSEHGFAWVLEVDGEVVGGIAAGASPHWFSRDITTCDLALFILPQHRGTRGCAHLVNAYAAWARGLGAVLINLGVMTGVNTEQTVALLERIGWKRSGVMMEI